MENLGKKVGYLKGMMDGAAEFDAQSVGGKLITGIVDLLGELCERVESVDELLQDLNDYVESIDDDLTELEGDRAEDLFEDDDEIEDIEDFDDVFDEGEDRLHLLHPTAEEEEEALAAKVCTACGRVIFTALDDPDDAEYLCPHCGERVRPGALSPKNVPIARPVEPAEGDGEGED